MSDQTVRAAGDFAHTLAFAVTFGVWLIGGAVVAVKLTRAALREPDSVTRTAGRTEAA